MKHLLASDPRAWEDVHTVKSWPHDIGADMQPIWFDHRYNTWMTQDSGTGNLVMISAACARDMAGHGSEVLV